MTIEVTEEDLADLNRIICAEYAVGNLSEQLFRGWMADYLDWSRPEATWRTDSIWFQRKKIEEPAPAVRLEPADPSPRKGPDDDVHF